MPCVQILNRLLTAITEKNTSEITNEFSSELDYFSAHSIEFNINDMAKPLDFSKDMVVGELYAPVKAEGNAEDLPNC